MTFIQRIKNIIELSKYEPGKPQDEYKQPGTQIITLIKKPEVTQKAIFIPRIPLRPIDQINSSENNV